MNELKETLKEKSIVFGVRQTLSKLKKGNIKKVFIASNCPIEIKDKIKEFKDKIDIKELDISNEELGIQCKKSFSISVLSY